MFTKFDERSGPLLSFFFFNPLKCILFITQSAIVAVFISLYLSTNFSPRLSGAFLFVSFDPDMFTTPSF